MPTQAIKVAESSQGWKGMCITMLKRIGTLCLVFLLLLFTGCGNEFAKEEYDSAEKIAQAGDRYAKEVSVFNPIEGGYSLTVSKFDGRETLWTETVKEEQDIAIDFSFSLSKGQAKVVHIDADGNVTTIIECSPETVTDGFVTKTVSLKSGKNRLKIVGYDCEDVELTMLFAIPQ